MTTSTNTSLYQVLTQLKQDLADTVLPAQSKIRITNSSVTPPPNSNEYESVIPCLQQQNRTIDCTIGDGNCFFRSVSKELFGTQCYHLEVRKLICEFEEQNP